MTEIRRALRWLLTGSARHAMAITGYPDALASEAASAGLTPPASGHVLLRPPVIAGLLAVVVVFLLAMDLTTLLARYWAREAQLQELARLFNFLVRLFSLDREQTIPSWFSTLLLALAAILLGVVGVLEWGRFRGPHWIILSAGFMVMSLDESASLHEVLIDPMRRLLGGGHLGLFYFAWVVPAIAVVAALGLYFLPFLRRLPPATARLFVLSAAIYLGGALGVEMIEGWFREANGPHNLGYTLLVCLEEGMEMFGTIAFIYALLNYISSRHPVVHVRLGHAPDAGA